MVGCNFPSPRNMYIFYLMYCACQSSAECIEWSSAMAISVHSKCETINTLRPRQNGRCFADDTFKRIFLNENVRISIKISLIFLPKGLIINNPALVQIMDWPRSGDKPLSEPMMVSLLTHICVTRPQWINWFYGSIYGMNWITPVCTHGNTYIT